MEDGQITSIVIRMEAIKVLLTKRRICADVETMATIRFPPSPDLRSHSSALGEKPALSGEAEGEGQRARQLVFETTVRIRLNAPRHMEPAVE